MSLSNFKPLLYIVLLYLFLKYLFVFLSPFICAYTFARLLYEIKSQRTFSFIIYFILLFILLIVFISFLYLFYKQTKTIYFELPQLIEHLSTTLYSFPLLNHYQSTIISLLNQIFPFISSL